MGEGSLGVENLELDRLVRALKLIGLSEYEARAYIALVELGEAEASEVSRRSGVPRTRIYDVLGRLESAGLIQRIGDSRPAIYSAIPPDKALEPLKRRIFEEVSQAIERLKIIHASTKAIPRFHMILLRGDRAYESALELVEHAKRDVMARIFYLPPRALIDFMEKVREFKRRGGRVHLYVDSRIVERELPQDVLAEIMGELGGKTYTALIPFSFISADFKNLLILYTSPGNPSECYGFLVHGVEEVGKIIREQLLGEQPSSNSF